MPEFDIASDGVRTWTSSKISEILKPYLKPCGEAFILTETPLLQALAYRGTTVIEADNPFVAMCHLKTALARRRNPDIAWELITPDILMNRFIDCGPDAKRDCLESFDPLVIQAFSWPKNFAASDYIGHMLVTRTATGHPTLFIVRSLQDLPTHALKFDPVFFKWLNTCPRVKLTVGSVTTKVRDREKALDYLRQHPGSTKPLRPVVHDDPTDEGPETPAPAAKTSAREKQKPFQPGAGRPSAEDCGVEPSMRRRKFGQKP